MRQEHDCFDCKHCHCTGWHNYYCTQKDKSISSGEYCEFFTEED